MVVIDGIDLDQYYVLKVPYNGTIATGGDSLKDDLNIWYEVSSRLLWCFVPSQLG